MDFYYFPRSSSQAAHILLHEAAIAHRAHQVDIFSGTIIGGGAYATVNPNGYVPALVSADGMLLTENVAIIDWISNEAGFMPPGDFVRTRHLQILAFLSTEVQKPFVRSFFTEDADERAELRTQIGRRLSWLADQQQGDFLFGSGFTGADAFAYVMLRWGHSNEVALPQGLQRLVRAVEELDSVHAVLALEGETPLLRRPS